MIDIDYINFRILDYIEENIDLSSSRLIFWEFSNKYRYNPNLDKLGTIANSKGTNDTQIFLRGVDDRGPKQTLDKYNCVWITNHSFEPIYYDVDNLFWEVSKDYINMVKHIAPGRYQPFAWYMLHSEQSVQVHNLPNYNFVPIHFFGNGVLAAEHWYRLYNGINLFTEYKPIKHRFICANRLIDGTRKYRIKFLNLIDVNAGLYSLLEQDPQTSRSLNEIVPGNNVKPNSFDEHCNSSAEIIIRTYDPVKHVFTHTPWATSFLHIVPETMIDRVHLTEKVFKPVVLKQPFVLLCGAGALNYLKGYGFKTFDGFWSEEYDNIQDEDKRLQAVADIVNRIGKMTLAECEQMREQMKPILEHNYNWFYNGFTDHCWLELRDNLARL